MREICRGNDFVVNRAIAVGLASAWIRGVASASKADVYDVIRNSLIASDKAKASTHGSNGVTGTMIDTYHD